MGKIYNYVVSMFFVFHSLRYWDFFIYTCKQKLMVYMKT